jgi:hypothetical protein
MSAISLQKGYEMKVLGFCLVLALLVSVPVFAQVTVGATGNFLAIGNYNVDAGSSDLGATVQLEVNGTIVIDEGDPVKYFFNQSDNNLAGVNNWMMPSYDDSAWKDGVNGVGYSSIQITAVPDTDDQGAIYTRFRRFDLPGGTASAMTIRIDYDDGVVVWLNGVEVLRSQFAAATGVPAWDWGQLTSDTESSNKLGPDPSRWTQPVSNLFDGQDNPDGSIINYTFEVEFDPTAVEHSSKLTTSWGSIKAY